MILLMRMNSNQPAKKELKKKLVVAQHNDHLRRRCPLKTTSALCIYVRRVDYSRSVKVTEEYGEFGSDPNGDPAGDQNCLLLSHLPATHFPLQLQ